jgi:hypothetical protein
LRIQLVAPDRSGLSTKPIGYLALLLCKTGQVRRYFGAQLAVSGMPLKRQHLSDFAQRDAGFWTEQYCSAKHPDTDQYADSQGDLRSQKLNPITVFLTIVVGAPWLRQATLSQAWSS